MDKMRISYNYEGGGFKVDDLCDRGYTYAFFLRNEVVPKEYTSMGISPSHAHVFYLFLTLSNKFHEVHLNNIYMSKKFENLSYTHHNCVKVQGYVEMAVREYQGKYCKPELHDKKSVDRVR